MHIRHTSEYAPFFLVFLGNFDILSNDMNNSEWFFIPFYTSSGYDTLSKPQPEDTEEIKLGLFSPKVHQLIQLFRSFGYDHIF